MPLTRLSQARRTAVGTKQVTKAVERGVVKAVFIARDAEARVTEPLKQLCQERLIQVIMVDTMVDLGRACGIEVGSASAAVIEE